MIRKKFCLTLLFILLFTFSAKADVSIPGFGRIDIDLVLDTKEDLSDYRFFLNFYGDLKEIKVNNKSQTTIAPMGGGARFAKAALLAIPRKNLSDFAEDSPASVRNLSDAVRDNKIEGVAELIVHTFRKDSPLGIKLRNNPSYLIVREGNTLSLIHSSDSGFQTYAVAVIIAGIFISVAVVIFGVFLFRKAFKKV